MIDFTLFELKFARSCKFPFKEGGPQGNAIVVGGIFDLHGTANQKQRVCTGYSLVDFMVTGNGIVEGELDPPLTTICT